MSLIGMQPTTSFSETDHARESGFKAGAKGTDSKGHEYVYVKVAASQTISAGHVVYWDSNYVATLLASAAPAPGVNGYQLGVAACTNTASVSMFMWAQVYGSCSLQISEVTASNLPGHVLVQTSHPGTVKGLGATASSYISGLILQVTASVTGVLYAGFANYPRVAPQ
jgi:hypothetical protein